MDIEIDLFGAGISTKRNFREKYSRLGQIIKEELGLTTEQAISLPEETKLGRLGEENFQDLKNWIDNHCIDRKP
jgi:hypothetical protein